MATTPARKLELQMSLLALAFTLCCFWLLRRKQVQPAAGHPQVS